MGGDTPPLNAFVRRVGSHLRVPGGGWCLAARVRSPVIDLWKQLTDVSPRAGAPQQRSAARVVDRIGHGHVLGDCPAAELGMLDPQDIQQLCVSLGGVAHTRELTAKGASRHALHEAVRAGCLDRLRMGVYCVPSLDTAVRSAIAHGGALGCASAAQRAGLWVMPHDGVHVWMTATGHERVHSPCTCVVHWDEGVGLPAPHGGCISLFHALKQIAQCCGEEAFFVALESALRQRRISRTELARLKTSVPREIAPLFALAADNADSGLESLIRYRLARLGIAVAGQVEVPAVGAVDLIIGDRLIVELDGKENHDGARKRHKDLRRDALAAPLGFEVLRFDYPMVMFSWGLVEAAILGKISAGAHETVAGRRMRATTRP